MKAIKEMSWRNKALLKLLFLFIALMLMVIDHRGIQAGDYIFRLLGLSPWSKSSTNTGFHYTVIIGLVALLISGKLVINHFRMKYDRVGRKVVIGCIVFFLIMPTVIRFSHHAIFFNGTGLRALDYSTKDYSCNYNYRKSSEEQENFYVSCKITIFNYGKQEELVELRPLLYYRNEGQLHRDEMELDYARIHVPPRSRATYSLEFTSVSGSQSIYGFTRKGGVQFRQDGEVKSLYWH